MPPNTETLIPQLIADYASTRRVEFELPDETSLPFIVAPSNAETTFPRVVFQTMDIASKHPLRMELQITAELQSSSDGADLDTENALTAKLRYILADKEAFETWLQAQHEAVRTGFRIWKYAITTNPTDMAADDKAKAYTRSTRLKVHVRTDELAPAA